MDIDDILKTHSEEVTDIGFDYRLKLGESPVIFEDFYPRISYDLLRTKKGSEICHTSESLTAEDFHLYFKKMNQLSNTKLGDLMNGESDLDFTIYSSGNKDLKDIFYEIMGGEQSGRGLPAFGRLALYNSESGEDKAPRIFFAIGHYATLHILVFDPDHKIYAGSH